MAGWNDGFMRNDNEAIKSLENYFRKVDKQVFLYKNTRFYDICHITTIIHWGMITLSLP